MACMVDEQLLDSLSRNLHALRAETGDGVVAGNSSGSTSGSEAEDIDSTNLNSVLQHILRAVNVLTESVRELKNNYEVQGEPVSAKMKDLEERARKNEDETDECCQRSMKGNFVIISKANPNTQKVSLIKTDAQLEEDGNSLVQCVISLASQKYGVRIEEQDIQACHRLPGGGIVLRLIRRGPGSAWASIVEKVKEGYNADMNVYFNFQLTRRRNSLVYELRQIKKDGMIHKFYTDENGHISAKVKNGDQKIRLTYYAKEKGKAPVTITIDELRSLVN